MRGVALLGILAMNIQDFSMIQQAYMNPLAYGDLHGWNYAVWYVCALLAEMKFMSIFSMLFGAGVYLMTSRIEASGRDPGPIHYRRMGWLAVFGCLHGYLLWTGDILFTYALGGAFAYLARKWQPKTLIISGLLFTAVSTVLFVGSYATLPYWPKQNVDQMRENMWMPSRQTVAKELAVYRAGWLGEEKNRAIENLNNQIQGNIFVAFWRAYGLMLVGMGLFKLGVFSAKLPSRVYGWFLAVGTVAGIPLTAFGIHQHFAHHWELRQVFFLDYQYKYWLSLLVCLFWIGLVMLICRKRWLPGTQRRLGAVGRMAFTNYLTHTIVCTFLFYGWGLGLYGKISRTGQFGIVLAIWAAQLIISPWWLDRFQFGPFEWIWRSLTYWKLQPMRKSSSQQAVDSPQLAPS
ncbi:MAG: DUF418 domain-containing protein, partial [Acidobacteriaceae bacterium]|nr:DUF418 domain-containing protein [Acidobacteriaceae bacterium]